MTIPIHMNFISPVANCTKNFIDNIKKFNMTYDINHLNNIEICKYCYYLWEDSCKIRDSRNIEQRIIDIL